MPPPPEAQESFRETEAKKTFDYVGDVKKFFEESVDGAEEKLFKSMGNPEDLLDDISSSSPDRLYGKMLVGVQALYPEAFEKKYMPLLADFGEKLQRSIDETDYVPETQLGFLWIQKQMLPVDFAKNNDVIDKVRQKIVKSLPKESAKLQNMTPMLADAADVFGDDFKNEVIAPVWPAIRGRVESIIKNNGYDAAMGSCIRAERMRPASEEPIVIPREELGKRAHGDAVALTQVLVDFAPYREPNIGPLRDTLAFVAETRVAKLHTSGKTFWGFAS